MAGGFRDNLRRLLGWWSSVPASQPESDYVVDECTVFHSPERSGRLYTEGRGDLLRGERGDLFTSWDRGDMLSSPDRGDRFTREC